MATQRTIQQQADGVSALRELVDLVKDPSVIILAHETVREQMILTEEQSAKYEEAMDFINKYDDLKTGLEKKEQYFKSIEKNQESKEAKLAEESKRLDIFSTNISNRENELKTASDIHKKSVIEFDKKSNDIMADVDSKRRLAETLRDSFRAKENSLKERENSMAGRESALAAAEDNLRKRVEIITTLESVIGR